MILGLSRFADRFDLAIVAKLIELTLGKWGGLGVAVFPSIYGGKANAKGFCKRLLGQFQSFAKLFHANRKTIFCLVH